jgi:hypothetical protein
MPWATEGEDRDGPEAELGLERRFLFGQNPAKNA